MFGWWTAAKLGAGGALVIVLVLVGDFFGWHAHKLAHLEAVNQARNDAIDYQAEHDENSLHDQAVELSKETQEFKAATKDLPGCPVTQAQADALNLVKDQ